MAGSTSLRQSLTLQRKALRSSAVVSTTSTASPLRQSSTSDARTSSICSWRRRWLQRRSHLDRSRYRDSISCDGANRASIWWPSVTSTPVNCRNSPINSVPHCVPAVSSRRRLKAARHLTDDTDLHEHEDVLPL